MFQKHLINFTRPSLAGPLHGGAEAVSVQRLSVPDLVVIDQSNQQPHRFHQGLDHAAQLTARSNGQNQPEAASLINMDLSGNATSTDSLQQAQQITFECLISYDKRKDKNLIVKWHHDDRVEPIYQWIPALNKRSIAPQYRAYIAPIVISSPTADSQLNVAAAPPNQTAANSQIQTLEAGFKLVRPSKELGGR